MKVEDMRDGNHVCGVGCPCEEYHCSRHRDRTWSFGDQPKDNGGPWVTVRNGA